MKKLIAPTLLVAGLVLAPTAAQARPVPDPAEAAYCGPGQTERVFDVRTGGYRTTCLPKPRIHKAAINPSLDKPWNPWSWIF